MIRERDEGGQYAEQVTLANIMEVFEQAETPFLTASEVAEELDCSRPSAYNKLTTLEERGDLRKKTVGSRAVVWWLPE